MRTLLPLKPTACAGSFLTPRPQRAKPFGWSGTGQRTKPTGRAGAGAPTVIDRKIQFK